MKRYLKSCIFSICLAVAALTDACHKMDETYVDFLEGGEIRYAKKADTIWASPGKNRIKLSTVLAGTNFSKYKVYWNDRTDSMEVAIADKKRLDTLNVMIESLMEGDYTFELYTYDKEQHRSVVTDVAGLVYGDSYQSTLFNRIVVDFKLDDSGLSEVIWDEQIPRQAVGVELIFKDKAQQAYHLIRPIEESTTPISRTLLGDSLQYRTLFLPDTNAIDTFYADFQTLHLATP